MGIKWTLLTTIAMQGGEADVALFVGPLTTTPRNRANAGDSNLALAERCLGVLWRKICNYNLQCNMIDHS